MVSSNEQSPKLGGGNVPSTVAAKLTCDGVAAGRILIFVALQDVVGVIDGDVGGVEEVVRAAEAGAGALAVLAMGSISKRWFTEHTSSVTGRKGAYDLPVANQRVVWKCWHFNGDGTAIATTFYRHVGSTLQQQRFASVLQASRFLLKISCKWMRWMKGESLNQVSVRKASRLFKFP